jgi:alkylation response protein AidB-like acyl-CoA dehydrogenase
MVEQARRPDVETGVEELLGKIKGLRGLIEAGAAADEDATQPADAVLSALEEAGVFKLMVPLALGGFEAHPAQVFDVLQELSYYDGSTGWYCQAATTGPAGAGAFLGERAVKEIFRSGGKGTVAGQGAPNGKAESVADGYRISGSYNFGSGIPNAEWIVGGYMLHQDGVPVKRQDGSPTILIGMVPRSTVEFAGNWAVLGLRGTGSYDFKVAQQIIHRDFLFDPKTALPQRGGALFKMGFTAIPALCHASFAFGCARRALDEWVEFAKSKRRSPALSMSQRETFQRDLAMAQADLRAAGAYVRRTFDQLFDAARSGNISNDLRLDARLSANQAVAVGARVSYAAYLACTTTALRNGSRLQRCFRDSQGAMAHFMTGEQSWIDGGRFLAGVEGALP